MLTGDQNIVNVHFRVIWQIDPAHPEDFVFNILNPRETVKAVAESIMREVVGLKTIDGILTTDRKSIEPDVQKRMQTVLERLSRRRAGQAGAAAIGRRAGAGRSPPIATSPPRSRTSSARSTTPRPTPTESSPRRRARPRASSPTPKPTRADHPRRARPDAALQLHLRPIQACARRDPRTHVSRDDGAGARRHEQDDPRRTRREPAGALPGARTVARKTGGSAEMRNPFSGLAILIAVVVAIVVASYTFFTVDPTEQALVLRFGQPVGDLISEPGLHVKVPVHRYGRLHRQAHPRPRQSSARRCWSPTISGSRSTPSSATASTIRCCSTVGARPCRAPMRSSAAC